MRRSIFGTCLFLSHVHASWEKNPPFAHALWSHEDGDLCCVAAHWLARQMVFSFHASCSFLFWFHRRITTECSGVLVANVFSVSSVQDHYRANTLTADFYPCSVPFYPTAGDSGDPASTVPCSILHPTSLWYIAKHCPLQHFQHY